MSVNYRETLGQSLLTHPVTEKPAYLRKQLLTRRRGLRARPREHRHQNLIVSSKRVQTYSQPVTRPSNAKSRRQQAGKKLVVKRKGDDLYFWTSSEKTSKA